MLTICETTYVCWMRIVLAIWTSLLVCWSARTTCGRPKPMSISNWKENETSHHGTKPALNTVSKIYKNIPTVGWIVITRSKCTNLNVFFRRLNGGCWRCHAEVWKNRPIFTLSNSTRQQIPFYFKHVSISDVLTRFTPGLILCCAPQPSSTSLSANPWPIWWRICLWRAAACKKRTIHILLFIYSGLSWDPRRELVVNYLPSVTQTSSISLQSNCNFTTRYSAEVPFSLWPLYCMTIPCDFWDAP